MPGKQINELAINPEALTTSSILHTQTSFNEDVVVTVQDVLDLAPVQPGTVDPGTLGTIDTLDDGIVVTDASDSHTRKRYPIDDFITLVSAGLPTVEGVLNTNGYYNIAGLQIRWGEFTSLNISGVQTVNFSVAFDTQCFGVWLNPNDVNSTKPIYAITKSSTGFTTDRDNFMSATPQVQYFAIGS